MKIKITYKGIIVFIIVLAILLGQVPWMFWNFLWIRTFLNLLLISLISIDILKFKRRNLIPAICIIILYMYFIFKDITNAGNISIIFLLISLFLLNNDQTKMVLTVLKKVVLILLIPSLILWIVHLLGFNLPYSNLSATWKDSTMFTSQYHNYYFFIVKLFAPSRFCFVFDEPGTLGTFLAFLLAADKFKISMENLFLFLAGLFTLSMAFIILVAIGVIIFKFRLTINRIIYGFAFILLIVTLLNTVPIFKKELLPRFKIENGTIAGNNRNTNKFSNYYEEFSKSKDVFIGKKPGSYARISKDINNPTYKMFIVDYGLVGLFILLTIYLIFLTRHFSYYSICFFFLFTLSFLQRPYALQSWQLILFFIVIENFRLENLALKKDYDIIDEMDVVSKKI